MRKMKSMKVVLAALFGLSFSGMYVHSKVILKIKGMCTNHPPLMNIRQTRQYCRN